MTRSKLSELQTQRDELDTAIAGLRYALDCAEPHPLACENFRQHLPGVLPATKNPGNDDARPS